MKCSFPLFLLLFLCWWESGSSFAARKTPAKPTGGWFESHSRDGALARSDEAVLTYLEINGWILTMGGVTVLIDPILEGPLDFGIPSLYSAAKRVLPLNGLIDALPLIDCLLITQGLDDHAHERTLRELARQDPALPTVAPPSARNVIERSGFESSAVRYLLHGESAQILPRTSSCMGEKEDSLGLVAIATQGALVGPPWQRRENGYIVRGSGHTACPSLYIEPHVEYSLEELRPFQSKVDVIITPLSGQGLSLGNSPTFELVHGPSVVLQLVDTLRPRFVIPMQNGEIDATGPVSVLVKDLGSRQDFMKKLSSTIWGEDILLLDAPPGEDIVLRV